MRFQDTSKLTLTGIHVLQTIYALFHHAPCSTKTISISVYNPVYGIAAKGALSYDIRGLPIPFSIHILHECYQRYISYISYTFNIR